MNLHDRLRLDISPDSMQATLFPITDYPSRTVRVKHVRALLEQHGVHYGVLEKSVDAFLKAWRSGSVQRPVLVARGSAPREATEGGLTRVAPPPRDGHDAVELLPLFVRKGERVISLEPPQAPAPGRSVRGEVLPPPPEVRPFSLSPGVGLEVRGKDWYATRTGFLLENQGQVEVSLTMTHLHDLPAGDYVWHGDVEIHGSLTPGVSLASSGTVHVYGGVQGPARVEAAHCIEVHGAVLGEGDTTLLTGGELRVDMIRACNAQATADFVLGNLCEDCHCRTRGVFRGAPGARIVGGRIDAVHGAELSEVGDAHGTHTVISAGGADWIDEEIQRIERQIRRWQGYYSKLYQDFGDQFGDLLDDRAQIYRLPAAKREEYETAYESVLEEQKRVDDKISELRSQQARLDRSRERDRKAVIVLNGKAFHGVHFLIRGKSYHVARHGLQDVTVTVTPGAARVVAIPTSLVESSDMELSES